MIDKAKFIKIKSEIIEAIISALDEIREKDEMGYILLLANGEYNNIIAQSINNDLSPYTIEAEMDRYFDKTRIDFLVNMLNNFYSFNRNLSNYDVRQVVQLEMMTYTHIWESILMLKKLYRIANLLKGNGYQWSVKISDKSKYDFIKKEIKDVLYKESALCQVIDKAYRSTLRNSFAHSLYYFESDELIRFNHQEKKKFDFDSITIDDWREHFLYSALLSYHLYKILDNRKQNIPRDFGKTVFPIIHPSKEGLRILKRNIYYWEDIDEFNFRPQNAATS